MTLITESVSTLDIPIIIGIAGVRVTLLGSECFHFKSVSINKKTMRALEDSIERGLFSNLFYSSLGGSSLGACLTVRRLRMTVSMVISLPRLTFRHL
jgi:hypothetical protein